MKFLFKLYIFLLCFIVFICLSLLFLDSTQDFTVQMDFKPFLTSNDLYSDYQGEYINFISANLGNLTLINKGLFNQEYEFKELIGCLNFKNSTKPFFDNRVPIYLSTNPSFSKELSNSNPLLSISKNSSIIYYLFAKWFIYSNSLSLNELKNNVVSVSIYEGNDYSKNPFGDYSFTSYLSCYELSLNNKPLKTILLFFD